MLLGSWIHFFATRKTLRFSRAISLPVCKNHSIYRTMFVLVLTMRRISLLYMYSWEYTRGRGKPRHGTASSVFFSVPHFVLKNVFQFLQGTACFILTAHVAGEFLGLTSLWSTNNRWLGLRQPQRHVTRFIVPSTLAKERLPHRTLACLCLKCIPGLPFTHANSPPLPSEDRQLVERDWPLHSKGASTLCRATECNKMRPCRVANGENNVDVNAAQLRQGFYMPWHVMRCENLTGKMSVSSKVCRMGYE